MTCTENLQALGSWTVTLSADAPVSVLSQLGYFGHVAIFRGAVDVTAPSDVTLQRGARYVGVLRDKSAGGRVLSGSGMLFWLGDEDHKGKVIETKLVLTGKTLTQCLTAVLPPSVTLGTVHDPGGTYTGTHQWQTPRDALDVIATAFGVEYRVNGDATLDVGTPAQLYNTTAPTATLSATGTGRDMDRQSLGTTFNPDLSAIDYTTRAVLLGQSTDAAGTSTQFVEATADAPSVPYLDMHGNPVAMTRMISDTAQTTSSAPAAVQLQLNRFNRLQQVLTVTAEDYDTAGTFVVGDSADVYDPDNGILDATREVTFLGEVIHPAIVRISGLTWPVTYGHTVAFRTQAGVWIDLTPWVQWETGTTQVTVGDLPKTLTSGSNPVADRQDAAPDASIPNAPTSLTLSSTSVLDAKGKAAAVLSASWTQPTLNTDGSVIQDLSYYLVQYRWHGRSPLWDTRITTDRSIDIGGLSNGLQYDMQVSAVDLSGNVSAPTAVSSIISAADSAAPNPPSDPVVSSYLGQLRIAWDGKDNTGAAMPTDFAVVEVHVSATSGFTPNSAPGSTTLVDQLSTAGVSYATAPYGSLRYVKLVAVDNSQNRSSPSNQVSGSTVQVADGDIAALSVGKLTAGTMTADVVIGGRFATSLTGARVEVNSLGFQKFDTDGVTKLISLTGTEALLTGVYKSALTGRRVEIGAGGTAGSVYFYAPDGTQTGLTAFTASTGVEAIRYGVPSAYANQYNKVQVETDELITLNTANVTAYVGGEDSSNNFRGFHVNWLSSRGVPNGPFPPAGSVSRLVVNATQTYIADPNTGALRLQVDGTSTKLWTPSRQILSSNESDGTRLWGVAPFLSNPYYGNTSLQVNSPGGPLGSAALTFWTAAQGNGSTYGAIQFFAMDSPGVNVRFQLMNWDVSSYTALWAAAFTVASDAAMKTQIRHYRDDATAHLRAAKVRRYIRKTAEDIQPGAEEIGLLAQEAPEQIVTFKDGTPHGIDLYQYAALLHKALQEIDARLLTIEGSAA